MKPKWYWAFLPYLDAPEKQRESALNAGYIKEKSDFYYRWYKR